MRELVGSLLELVEGQSHDVAFEKAQEVSVADYLAMAAGKTGSLIGCACALVARWPARTASGWAALREFGRSLGVAFQCTDDILGILGPQRAQRQAGRRRPRRAQEVPAGGGALAAAERLRELYRTPHRPGETDVDLARHLVEEAGGRQAAEEEARRHLAAALRSLSLARPTADAYRQLHDIAWAMTRRES
ncbi:family 2 encapsulin nanocompartment cargo protein polyprenyl transferase [Streptomyces violaceorubidus]